MEEKIHTRIWDENAEPDNSFAAAACYCHGYDVYGDLLGNASWVEYLYLLFRGEAPTAQQAKLLEGLAVALANPGPRDASVHAAMCGGVGGSTAASCLTAALAVGAGSSGGAREIYNALGDWQELGTDLAKWQARLNVKPVDDPADVWPAAEHSAGFDPYGVRCATPVLQTLNYLSEMGDFVSLRFLAENRTQLEAAARNPLAMTGVAAAALNDLGCNPDQGEMLFLMLRLPGAAVHALEQKGYGYKNFPFFEIELENDPGPARTTEVRVGVQS